MRLAVFFGQGENTMRTILKLTTIVPVALALLGGEARSQMSAEDIIRGLSGSSDMTTRGIRLGSPTPAAPAASQPATAKAAPAATTMHRAATGCPSAGTSAGAAANSVQLMVNFTTGSAGLTPAARACLDELAKALGSSALSAFRFRIAGHTDNVGSPDENLKLSQARAAAVVDYLARQHGIAATRLETAGFGQDRPLVEQPAQTAEPRNRRVEVVNLGS